ncbi:MAG: ATP-binding protein, partial [Syntrophorhabdaceae bacterium]|nr:ATP-binding protein [Syntrophorhabdaceae bacterium]
LHMLVTSPLNKVKDKIQDITEDRADLTELVPDLQKDEIGELARWFNKLTAKVGGLLDGLREADERAQNLLDATPLCASLWDKDAIIFCNQVAATLFDLSGKQEFKDRFFELLPERQPCGGLSRELLFEYKTKALEEGECSFEWVHQKLNGDPIPCEVKFVRIKHRGKHILASYILDLRERYEMLNALREESTKFEAAAHWHESILDSIPFPISVQDKEAKWIFINATLERLLGKNRKDIVGLPCSDWGVSICNTDDCAIACAKRGEKQTYFKQDGVSYQVDIEILKDLKGETTGYIEVIQDITRLEQAAKQHAEAEAASIAKSAFLAKMSHEIRTPINAVLGITEMQLQDTSHSLGTRDAFGKIYTAGYTLLGIINEILDLSKIESGKMELIPAKYEIVSLISDTVQLNMARIGSKPIEFKLYIDENIPLKLFGDELRIKQILNNLLSNAFKYTQEGKVELSVSVEHESKETDSDVTIVFHVNDTGQGMTESQVQVLFHEYSRFDMVANRMIEGTGLGMNITQHLVSMMNGEIFVESEPGEGTLFTVRLPQGRIGTGVVGKDLAQSLQLFKKTAMSHTKAAQLVREPMPYGNVLIVDDLEMNLYVGKGLMAPYGLSIDTALSGFEAIEKIRSGNEYDIVFMDHMMPKMDGIEATKTLRDLMGYTRPIVALTASAVVGQEEMFLENGFDDFISKPVDLYRMDMVLNKFIRDKQPPEVIDAARRQQNKNSENVADDKMPNITADPQLAKIFARDAERALITLEAVVTNRFRRDNDLQIFVINIHAMKSALINIGEPALANNAYKLEQAGKSGNISVMLSETAAFLTDLQAVIKKVKPKQEG